ncbi:MAG TPA: ATP synthase F1 subunit gamma [Candidatus Goldiibacteriota bacterium]|nr:ATP synthase F1 subunit gamma [Candidatus Goldiibacteriota bacterium]
MATLREIRKRIKSAKNIQQITKAMKMVAAAKLKKAQERILAARPYADKIREVISELIPKADPKSYPILAENKGVTKEAIVLVTSDKGLCGSYNTNLVKEVLKRLKENPDISLFFIGKKGMDALKKFGKEMPVFKYNDKNINWNDIEYITGQMIQDFKAGKYRKVDLIYSEFQTSLAQKIAVRQLLPVKFEVDEAKIERKEFIYEPAEEQVLADLLIRYVKTQLYRAIFESQAAEHGVRMVSMEMATNNAGDMIRALTLVANKTRQASITKEILEIVGGAEAIKG